MKTYILKISFHASVHNILFPSYEEAKQELDKLNTELNKDRFARNEKKENTFTIISPAGPMVIVLEKVESARIHDLEKHLELAAPVNILENKERLELLEEEFKLKQKYGITT